MKRGNLPTLHQSRALLIRDIRPALPENRRFGAIPLGHVIAAFLCSICEIRGSSSLRPEWPLAVTKAAWSAAGGRGYTEPR